MSIQESYTGSGRPYLAIQEDVNAGRSVFVDKQGNPYHLDAKIKGSFKGTVGASHTFPNAVKGIGITNDGSADLVLTVNGITIDVYVGEYFEGRFDEFTSIQVQGASAYRGFVTD